MLLRINFIKVNEERNENENDNEIMMMTNLSDFSDFSALKRLAEGFNSKLNHFLSHLTMIARKIKSSFFNK